MLKQLSKAQSTAEYAIVIGLVIAAAVGMQIYVKRQLQGKIKDAVIYTQSDAKGKYGIGTGTEEQYEPYYSESSILTSANRREETETFTGGGVKRTTAAGDEKTTRKGSQNIIASPNSTY